MQPLLSTAFITYMALQYMWTRVMNSQEYWLYSFNQYWCANCPNTCDVASLCITNLVSFLAAVHVNTSFEALFEASHLSYTLLTMWSHGSYINFNKLLWNYKFITIKSYCH